ncbi:MAG: hypothetical protein AAF542_16465 [Pseudomonadota bacterium]
MSVYLIGNLLGRLFTSLLIVFVILIIMKKGDIGLAWQNIKRPMPIFSVLGLFLLGIAAGVT